LIADLRAHLAAHPQAADPDAALWPGRAPGTHAVDYSRPWDSSNWHRWYFKPALVARGLRVVRLHDLRHSYASLMWAAGVDLSVVSRWLGHANVATTDAIYAHLYRHDHASDRERFAAYGWGYRHRRRADLGAHPDTGQARVLAAPVTREARHPATAIGSGGLLCP